MISNSYQFYHAFGISNSLSREEEAEFVLKYRNGSGPVKKMALSRLLTANMPYILKEASRIGKSHKSMKDDYTQEAVIGFINGLQRFKPSRNIRLMTYVKHWIRAIAGRAYTVDKRTKKRSLYEYQLNQWSESNTTLDDVISEGVTNKSITNFDDVYNNAQAINKIATRIKPTLDKLDKAILNDCLIGGAPEVPVAKRFNVSRQGLNKRRQGIIRKMKHIYEWGTNVNK